MLDQSPPPMTEPEIEAAGSNADGSTNPVRLAAGLISASIIILALYYGRDILIPLAVASLIGLALNPPITWLTKRGLPRILSISLVMAVVLALISVFGMLLGTQIRSLATEFPTYQSTISKKLTDLREEMQAPGVFARLLQTVERVRKEVAEPEQRPPEAAPPPPQKVEVVGQSATPIEQAMLWLGRAAKPLATAGIILVFVFLVLLDRSDLRDRFLRLLGRDVHRSTDSMQEAGGRVSRYLLMQLLVNVSYGVPMGLGLWLIGVPGALLWGTVAAVMRFVPFIGPMISAVFPIALAFAIDDGWSMVIWTVSLIVTLEIISNNIVEPKLYGSSTGLSAISLIAAAMFWTAIWGPMGLILSTPITVCLLVLGRNVPQLQFLDVLLGSTPVLDLPTRIYQRLIAGDVDEAIDIAQKEIADGSVIAFYDETALQVLRQASEQHLRRATAEHRLRLASGMDTLLEELRLDYPAELPAAGERVVCLGGKWDIDALAAEMVAHALCLEGVAAKALPAATVDAHYVANLELEGTETVCLSYFSENPAMQARHLAKRLRLRWPDLQIVIAAWNAPEELLHDKALPRLYADAVVTSLQEAVSRIHRLVDPEEALTAQQAGAPENETERVDALHKSGILDPRHREMFDAVSKRAADVFDTAVAVISAIDDETEHFVGQSGKLPESVTDETGHVRPIPREEAICNYVVANGTTLVVPDIERDPRFADNEKIREWGVRFYAGTPLRTPDGLVFGAFCILDEKPRSIEPHELALLESMAADIVSEVTGAEQAESRAPARPQAVATVGQRVPE
jgi:predicted PurR-regulated permease PerM